MTVNLRTLQDGGRIYEATMFLDGEEVFRHDPDDEEARTFAILHHLQFASRRGPHTVDIRLDRIETSPTPVQIRIFAFYHVDPLNTEPLDVPDDVREVTVREGEVVRVAFEA